MLESPTLLRHQDEPTSLSAPGPLTSGGAQHSADRPPVRREDRPGQSRIWLAGSQDPCCVQIFPTFLLQNLKVVLLTAAREQARRQTSTSAACTHTRWTVPLACEHLTLPALSRQCECPSP